MVSSLFIGEFLEGSALEKFSTPRSYYRHMRSFWALSSFEKKDIPLIRHPFARAFQPSAALIRLLCPGHPEWHEPICQFPSGSAFAETGFYTKEDQLPLLPELCQLALLWVLIQENEPAHRLIEWLLPFLHHTALWASESKYDPQEFYCSAYLLYKYVGLSEKAEEFWQKALSFGEPEPFFPALEKALAPFVFTGNLNLASHFHDQNLGAFVNESTAFSLSGHATSLGSFEAGFVSVPAFGPQFYPLTNLNLFGVRGIHQMEILDEKNVSGWTQCFADPQVWLHTHLSVSAEETKLTVQWLGLSSQKKCAFVFYVRADTAHIENEVFRSKSLQRYKGLGKAVSFNEGALTIICPTSRSLELIPLAGEGCFWGADFLLAFSVNAFDPSGSFVFKK